MAFILFQFKYSFQKLQQKSSKRSRETVFPRAYTTLSNTSDSCWGTRVTLFAQNALLIQQPGSREGADESRSSALFTITKRSPLSVKIHCSFPATPCSQSNTCSRLKVAQCSQSVSNSAPLLWKTRLLLLVPQGSRCFMKHSSKESH